MSLRCSSRMVDTHEKRGIPGVNSDSYHFAHFEDSTAHHNVPQKHGKYDSMLETMYIFFGMLLVYLLVTFLLFAVREYTWSLNKRKKLLSNGSAWSNNSRITLQQLQPNMTNLRVKNPAYPDTRQEQPRTESLRNGGENDVAYTPIEVVRISSNYSPVSDQEPYASQEGNVYTLRELFALKPVQYFGAPLVNSDDLNNMSLETAIKMSIPIRHIEFYSAWTAEKTVAEIVHCINHELDAVSRKIAIYRLIVIGANSTTLKNSNVFLLFFSKAMDELIDTGAVFDILNESNAYISRALIDILIQYCYAQKLLGDTEDPVFINNFVKWKGNKPLVQSSSVLFRYLVNLQLGIHTLTSTDGDTLQLVQGKIKTLLVTFASNLECEALKPVLEIIFQAVEFSETEKDASLFYVLLLLIVSKHQDCCSSILFEKENSSLAGLVQLGLLPEFNNTDIKISCRDIEEIAFRHNPESYKYFHKTDTPSGELQSHMKTSKRTAQLAKDTVSRPGAWNSQINRNTKQ